MDNPYEPRRAEPPSGEGWAPFVGGVLVGLVSWLPVVLLVGLLGALGSGAEGGALFGMYGALVPGLAQIPAIAGLWLATRGAFRRGLLVGAGIVAFLNATCWGLLLLPGALG